MTDTTQPFEIVANFGGQSDQPDPFAVLTNPGPDTPRGALAAAQDAVDAADLSHLEPDAHVMNAGTVSYDSSTDTFDVTLNEAAL